VRASAGGEDAADRISNFQTNPFGPIFKNRRKKEYVAKSDERINGL
jgi:hypothetical protein